MKKLLICALCALTACQSERHKVSKEVDFDVKSKYNVVLGRYPAVYAARERTGKWHVFVADSALEMVIIALKNMESENKKLQKQVEDLQPVRTTYNQGVVGYTYVDTAYKPHQKYEVGKTYCENGNCFTVGYSVIPKATGIQNVAIGQTGSRNDIILTKNELEYLKSLQ